MYQQGYLYTKLKIQIISVQFSSSDISHSFQASWLQPQFSPLCFRCGLAEGTLLHSTWQCSKLQGFWQGIYDALSTIHGVTFPMDPEVCLLGNLLDSNIRHSHSIKLTEIPLATAKLQVEVRSPITCWIVALRSEQLHTSRDNNLLTKE